MQFLVTQMYCDIYIYIFQRHDVPQCNAIYEKHNMINADDIETTILET